MFLSADRFHASDGSPAFHVLPSLCLGAAGVVKPKFSLSCAATSFNFKAAAFLCVTPEVKASGKIGEFATAAAAAPVTS